MGIFKTTTVFKTQYVTLTRDFIPKVTCILLLGPTFWRTSFLCAKNWVPAGSFGAL